jgi:acyl carrier protein
LIAIHCLSTSALEEFRKAKEYRELRWMSAKEQRCGHVDERIPVKFEKVQKNCARQTLAGVGRKRLTNRDDFNLIYFSPQINFEGKSKWPHQKGLFDMNTDAQTVQNEIIRIICDELDVTPDQLHPATSLVGDLKADSLALINLVMAIEEKFSVEVPNDALRTFNTIGDITSYVETRMKAA